MYKSYLTGGDPAQLVKVRGRPRGQGRSGFLVMKWYGPFDVGSPEDLASLVENFVALSLHLAKAQTE